MALRSLTALLIAGGLAAPVLAQAQQMRPAQDDHWCSEDGWGSGGGSRTCAVFESSWAASGPLSVDANPNGGISVTGWNRNEVRLRAKVTTQGPDEEAARAVAAAVQVHAGANVHAEGPESSNGRSWSVSYQLQVPQGMALSLRSTNGGIHLEDVSGDLNFTTTNGGLHLKNVGGHVVGRTTNGGLHVELGGTEWQGEGLELITTNGGIHLEAPRGYNAHLIAGTTNGSVDKSAMAEPRRRSSKDADDDDDDDEDADSGGSRTSARRRRTIETDLGSGGRTLRLQTTNGGVHVSKD